MTAWERLKTMTLSVANIRQVDQIAISQYHMHSLVLMENAALGCARWLVEHVPSSPRVVILCGRGNNGGDGLAILRHLQLAGWNCTAIVLGPLEKLSQDAQANWNVVYASASQSLWLVASEDQDRTTDVEFRSEAAKLPCQFDSTADRRMIESVIMQADLVIDAMLGTGAGGEPRTPLAEWIQWANAAPHAQRVAIDIPTGLDAETGRRAMNCFRADHTLTFVARKPGFIGNEAVLGQVEVLPIGIPEHLVKQLVDQSLSSGPAGGS